MSDRGRAVTWLDVFAAAPLTGNGLLVVHDADGLDEDAMLAVTRETNLSEAAFVQTATVPGADYRLRIFTPAGELPFAGHPSLGTAVAVARARGMRDAEFVQQTGAGCQPVRVQADGARARASMLQEPAVFGARLPRAEVLAAAGLDAAAAHPELEPQVVSTGVAHLLAPIAGPEALRAARPDPAALRALLDPLGAVVLYLVAPGDEGHATARGFFCAEGRLVEDPATGSAAGPLLAYLRERAGTEALRVAQGAEIGRPSVIDCAWEDGVVHVAGDVVVLAEGESVIG